jgi:cephalosporin-C deacetylase-like acetyl esterase
MPRLSRRELLVAGAASVAAGLPVRARAYAGGDMPWTQAALKPPARHPANLTIRDYLVREARRITDESLVSVKTAADFKQQIGERRRLYIDMMGLGDLPAAQKRPRVAYEVTGVVERPGYRIEKLHYESLPNLHVTSNLYLPASTGAAARRPGVLYVCGHLQNQKVAYQAHAKRFAELGFPTLIVETVQLGEVTGYHHGCYREGWFHWYSRGYSPAAIELLNGIRGLDLLAGRAEVDPDRLGVTGISGGGAVSWWIGAADERVKACSPVCGTATIESHVYDRVIDGHCDCMWWVNTALWDLADIGALIAPRPLLIASANQDGIFPIESIRRVHGQLERLYRTLGRAENIRFVETPGGHSYHERSRTAIFSFFLQHLMGKTVPPGEVGDIELDDAKLESVAALTVYSAGPPPGNRATTVQDQFVPLAAAPAIAGASDVARVRKQLVDKLLSITFNHFPRNPPPLDVEEEFALDGGVGTRFAFTSESGWRLHGVRRNPRDVKGSAPAVVVLRSPGEERGDSDAFAEEIRVPWVKVIVETRGTGDTSWGDDLNWHVRRATAWLGRTIASMRVWDAVRALQAARTLPGVDAARLAIAARGEMGAVALYAALLDGRVSSILLDSPPSTQNAASQKDGKGPAIEMLSCLRYTDLPHVAGLLHPADVVVSGDFPSTYAWGEDLYKRFGSARFQRVKAMPDWQPRS